MAISFSSTPLKSIICLLLLAASFASSARILDEATPQIPFPSFNPGSINPTTPFVGQPGTTLPSGQFPATTIPAAANVAPIVPTEPVAPVVAPIPDTPDADAAPVIAPVPDIPETDAPPVEAPVAALPSGGAATNVPPVTTPGTALPAGGAAVAASADHPVLSFFMHDILGGSQPTGRVVAGLASNTDANSFVPFSKPSNPIFPIDGGVPLNTVNGAINNNNFPFLVGLNGSPGNALVQSNGNNAVNGGDNQAFVTAGNLPAGLTVQQLMFGSVTVVDNEITEGHELGTGVLGKVQGFYLTSSTDGSSHTLVLTALFHGNAHEADDTISFFGVHRTATPISHIAIIGGTGKYENAKGYATIETLPHVDQHTTDGVETITHFALYITP